MCPSKTPNQKYFHKHTFWVSAWLPNKMGLIIKIKTSGNKEPLESVLNPK